MRAVVEAAAIVAWTTVAILAVMALMDALT